MSTRDNTPRLLGAAFLAVIVTSAVSGGLAISAMGTGGVAEILTRVAANEGLIRWSTLAAMVNAAGIVVLATLLYTVLRRWSEPIAVIVLGCWLGEAAFYAIAQLGVAGLLPLSQDFVRAGSPATPDSVALGQFLYSGIYKLASDIYMFFYSFGGLLAYALFFRSKSMPRLISGFGVFAASVGLGATALELLGNDVPMAAFYPIALFEAVVGGWLLFKGLAVESIEAAPAIPTAHPAAEPRWRRRRAAMGLLGLAIGVILVAASIVVFAQLSSGGKAADGTITYSPSTTCADGTNTVTMTLPKSVRGSDLLSITVDGTYIESITPETDGFTQSGGIWSFTKTYRSDEMECQMLKPGSHVARILDDAGNVVAEGSFTRK